MKTIKHLPGPADRMKLKKGNICVLWAHENMDCHTEDTKNEGEANIIILKLYKLSHQSKRATARLIIFKIHV